MKKAYEEEMEDDSRLFDWFAKHLEDLSIREQLAFMAAHKAYAESLRLIYDQHCKRLLGEHIANHAPDTNKTP